MKVRSRWWMGVFVASAAIIVSLTLFFPDGILKFISREARPAVRSVIQAQQLVHLKGGYWDGEMAKEAELLKTKPTEVQLEFFKGVILTCKLDTSTATHFVELVGNQGKALSDHLKLFMQSQDSEKLSSKQSAEVKSWIKHFEQQSLP